MGGEGASVCVAAGVSAFFGGDVLVRRAGTISELAFDLTERVFGWIFGRDVNSIEILGFLLLIAFSSWSRESLGRFRPTLGSCCLLSLLGRNATLALVDLVVRPSFLLEERVKGDAIDPVGTVAHISASSN